MPRISDEIINEVLAKTDLVEVVSEKVALSKQGKSYFGLCPFHHEKTPSFSVEPERKIYNCFSCGEKGNAITFKQKLDNLSFVEAIEDLAIKANIDISFDQYKTENPNQKYFDINEDAKNFYKLYLTSTKQGQIAKEYLHKRNITDDLINQFEFGLAPSEYDLLHKTLTSKDYLVSDLHDLGLVKQSKQETFYDLFRDRIIFPIHDERGNVVAFSGRTYIEGDETAKYINSPQTKVFTKSNVLYNLHNAINEIKRVNRIILFEGYMDVIASYRAGFKESVASMGTSLTKEQVRLMKKYTNSVTICYDGDSAGIEATSRAITLFKQEHMEVKIVVLPDNLDPDDYIKQYGTEELHDYIDNKWIDEIEFNYMRHQKNADFSKMLDIEQFKKQVFNMIRSSSNTVVETYIKKLSTDIDISIESIRQDFNQYTKRNISEVSSKYRPKVDIFNKYEYAERRLINYFLKDVNYIKRYRNEFGPVFCIKQNVLNIHMLIEDMYQEKILNDEEPVIEIENFIEKLDEAQLDFFNRYCRNDHIELIQQEFEDLIEVIHYYKKELGMNQSEAKIKEAQSIEEKIKLAKYRDLKIKEDKHGQR